MVSFYRRYETRKSEKSLQARGKRALGAHRGVAWAWLTGQAHHSGNGGRVHVIFY